MTLYSESVTEQRPVLMCDRCGMTERGNLGVTKEQWIEYFHGLDWKAFKNREVVLHFCPNCVHELEQENWFQQCDYEEVAGES